MKKILRWRFLFGFLVIFTILITFLTLYGISRERSRFRSIVGELIRTAKNIDSTNHITNVIVDSLVNKLSYLSSQVTLLEAQKDSLIGKTQSRNGISPKSKKITANGAVPVRRPVFTVIDKAGKAIGKDGVAGDSIKGMRVIAGAGFSIRRMDVTVGRNAARVYQFTGVSGSWDWGHLSSTCGPGDRIVVSIKKVVKLTSSGAEENVDVGTVLITIPIRSSYRPHFSITDSKTGNSLIKEGVNHTDIRGLMELYVRAGSGYLVRNMEITLMRGAAKILETTLNDTYGILDLSKWAASMRDGDRVVIDVKRVTVRAQSGFDEEFDAGEVILTIPIK